MQHEVFEGYPLAGCGTTRCMHTMPLESSKWRRCHNSLRMLKKARLLTRSTPARRGWAGEKKRLFPHPGRRATRRQGTGSPSAAGLSRSPDGDRRQAEGRQPPPHSMSKVKRRDRITAACAQMQQKLHESCGSGPVLTTVYHVSRGTACDYAGGLISFSNPGRNDLKKAFLTKLTTVCHVLVRGFSRAPDISVLVATSSRGVFSSSLATLPTSPS
jgi:hypothetical protein